MATSNSINLSAVGLDIIKEAYEQLGVIEENGTPSSAQQTSAARTLNYMIKAWQAEGINLYAIQKLTLFLAKDTSAYNLSSTGGHVTASFVKTAVATAASSGASSIDVDSISGISASDYIGIELADGTMQWTTVNGAPSGVTITLTAALTDDVAVDAAVFTYTTKAHRPMKIVNAVRTTYDEIDVPVNIYPLDKYINLSNKTDDGQVVSIYYDPQVGTGICYVWPQSSSVRDRLTLWVQRTLHDIDTVGTDEVDFPQEWFLALSLNLALLLEPKYGLPTREKNRIAELATYYKDLAEGYDREDSIEIIPDYQEG